MKTIVELLFILLLGILFYQDIKERKVSVWILVCGIIVGGSLHFIHQNSIVFVSNIGMNLSFVGLIIGVLFLYAKFKLNKKLFDVFGAGDVLFFILLAVSLPILSFLMLFVFSLVFSLLIFMLLKNGFTEKTVPLAGLQSLFLGLVFIANKLTNTIDLYAL
jgi:Flp pilus assembly protein protease CpaA